MRGWSPELYILKTIRIPQCEPILVPQCVPILVSEIGPAGVDFSDHGGPDLGMVWLSIWGSLWVWFWCRVCGLIFVLLADNQLEKTRMPVCTAVVPARGPKAPSQEVSGTRLGWFRVAFLETKWQQHGQETSRCTSLHRLCLLRNSQGADSP